MRARTNVAAYVAPLLGLMMCAAGPSEAQPIPIRELNPADAKTTERFGSIFGVRQLADGRVMVNDGERLQLIILDAKLANRTVLLDTQGEGVQSYGLRPSPFIPHLADSTFFVDEGSRTLVLIDPMGKIGRIASVPKSSDMIFVSRGTAGVDANGNLLYRPFYARTGPPVRVNGVAEANPDTAPVVRANFESRTVDTIAVVRVQPPLPVINSKDSTGKTIMTIVMNPIHMIDEWAVLADGSLAMVRGHDYHVDIIQPDGRKISGPKLPFDFRRLTDEDKQKLLDSARTAELDRRAAEVISLAQAAPGGGGRGVGPGNPGMRPTSPRPRVEFVPLDKIQDYYPPIRSGAAKPDADGNLWILPTTSARSLKGELVYDVVNNRGEMKERVRLPLGRSIAGFGSRGVIYLMSRDETGWLLERTRVSGRP